MKKDSQIDHWVLLFPICLFLFYDFVQINMMNTLNPFITKDLSVQPSTLGFISSLLLYVNLVLLIPAGFLLDRYRPSRLVALSIIPTVIGSFIAAHQTTVATLIIWRALSGFTGAFSYLSCVKMISMNFSHKRIGMMIGGTGIVIMLAGVFSQTPLYYIVKNYGFSVTLIINAVFGLFVMIMMLMSSDKKYKKTSNLNEMDKLIKSPYKSMINWLISLLASLANFPLFVLGAVWSSLFLFHVHSVDLHHAASITAMIYIGNIFGAPLVGFITDRSGDRVSLMIAMTGLFLISILLITQVKSISFLYVLYFILGISTAVQTLAYSSIVDFNEKHHIAKATSLVSLLTVGLGGFAQNLFGIIVDIGEHDHYLAGMSLLILAAVIALSISIYLNTRKRYLYKISA